MGRLRRRTVVLVVIALLVGIVAAMAAGYWLEQATGQVWVRYLPMAPVFAGFAFVVGRRRGTPRD
ncbi:hypothetical protein [Lentzea sp. NPDC003310]|uniref:hypothetical protein n=1 Tax=Lentzea sp. NPDC003310 TaxID=3154447 RepID=UPI0033B1DF59